MIFLALLPTILNRRFWYIFIPPLTDDVPSELIFTSYCITSAFNFALIGVLGACIYGEPYSAAAWAAAACILGIGAAMFSRAFL
jgi:hypothetical protein